MAIEFVTTRELANKAGEITGKVRIIKLKEQPEALVDYTCPACGNAEKRKEAWQEPFLIGIGAKKKMNIVCAKCGHKMTILKLKKQIAKEKKKEKKKKK